MGNKTAPKIFTTKRYMENLIHIVTSNNVLKGFGKFAVLRENFYLMGNVHLLWKAECDN